MLRSTLPRAARVRPFPTLRRHQQSQLRRTFATGSNGTPPPSAKQSRILQLLDRWIERSPAFAQKPLIALRHAPASYIISFAVLHELTAVVPLVALFCGFHYFRWLPPWFAEGEWAIEAVEKMGKWFRKRGWIDAKEEAYVEEQTKAGNARLFEKQRRRASEIWNEGEGRGRILIEVATAYTIVKFLVPVRVVLSAFWAPWFANSVLLPTGRVIKRVGSFISRIIPRS
ncbi:uncharacterized protein HMPREF1541_10202 [Cyphellophora europaea CBS 101466]|uniref:Uncharacterized protein n=1 Tax=Cyphellophora europaea (strain CBS 101466) TaxID=1220924 RepID=W2S770_CYPE1|nr:uncharacterized protein HMPREF1541_10202 [Cyphellophora europaea CBS 101466]ETN44532.1 hypothetical protein HMPREF1541_10202 [Cyphellophora europaea CBS 101466]